LPYSIRKTSVIPIVSALILAPFFFAQAETTKDAPQDGIKTELNRLTDSLDLLTAIKAAKRPTDATSLQTALNTVVSITDEEIKNISGELNVLEDLTDAENALASDYMENLVGLRLYVKSVRTDTTQEAAPSAILSLAQKFKEWRDGPYATALDPIMRFTNVFQSKDDIKAANARLGAILKDERKIRTMLSATKTAPFMRLIKKVQTELRKATDLTARAEALLTPDAVAPDDASTIDEEIRQSNALVDTAYDDFIAMGKLIKK
jgi:hypothetical protein